MAETDTKSRTSEAVSIHEAELASGPSGAVIKGKVILFDAAVQRRRERKNVVVCGENRKANRRLARQIEEAIGPSEPHEPHPTAGPAALPHFQSRVKARSGHTFYETEKRKARKRR
jgi:hypothetical protein